MTSGAAQNAGRRSCPPAWPAAQSAELASWIDTDIEYTDLQAGMARKRGELADFLGKIRSDERLLDVGCGPVSLLTVLPPAAEKVAVDSLIDAYAARYPRSPDVRYAKQVSEALEFPDNHFDRVCCLNALDHFRDPFASLAEMSRVLRRGGTLLLEYENTSPLVRWACRRGYRPPLNRFHPHHLSSPVVVANCRQNGLRLVAAVYTPAFTFTKFRYLGELVSGRRHRGSYEKMVSSTASGPAVFVIHNLLGLGERLLFPLNPMAYAGFTRLKFMKQ